MRIRHVGILRLGNDAEFRHLARFDERGVVFSIVGAAELIGDIVFDLGSAHLGSEDCEVG